MSGAESALPRIDSSLEINRDVDLSAQNIAKGFNQGLVVYDNFAVYALVGNANNDDLQDKIRIAKGEGRGSKQPVGWTVPFSERSLSTIDVDVIKDQSLQELLRDPDELTARLGGLSFVRAQADMKQRENQQIPDSIIPDDGQTVQIYSPEGTTMTSKVIRAALAQGIEPVMTSANESGEPESVTETAAYEFTRRAADRLLDASDYKSLPIMMAVNRSDEDKPDRPLGSYPVIVAEAEQLKIVRPGCFDPEILKRVLDGLPVVLAEGTELQKPKYPNSVLRLIDLPSDVKNLRGPELRLGVLAAAGFTHV